MGAPATRLLPKAMLTSYVPDLVGVYRTWKTPALSSMGAEHDSETAKGVDGLELDSELAGLLLLS